MRRHDSRSFRSFRSFHSSRSFHSLRSFRSLLSIRLLLTLLLASFAATMAGAPAFAHGGRGARSARPARAGTAGGDRRGVSLGACAHSRRRAESGWHRGRTGGRNRIARIAIAHARLDLWESARLLALVNFAMADGFVAGFDGKYAFRFWRPITAIRAADTDGNAGTERDPGWEPFLVSPRCPTTRPRTPCSARLPRRCSSACLRPRAP